ncbi:MAG: 2-hydroxyacyl-CoA dehydratase [Candidatus Rokubacteria bacterium]|nr:2-hydroxyacyl-CoA dehydratase [Candidatus Rokubacteria bacterium]
MTSRALAEVKIRLERRPREIEELRSAGRKVVGTFCVYVPEELIHAAGLIPIRLVKGGNPDVDALGDHYLSTGSCPFARACLGYKEVNRDPYFASVDAVAEAPTCLQMERVLELYHKYFGVEILPISFPRTYFYAPDADGFRFFMDQLQWFKGRLEELAGAPITEERLRESIRLFDATREKLHRIYGLLRMDVPPLRWEEAFKLVHAGFYLDRREYDALLGDVIAELEAACDPAAADPDAGPDSLPRLMIFGGCLADGDDKIVEVVKSVNARVVIDDFCTGSRVFWNLTGGDTLEELAKRYLTKVPCGSLPYPHREGDPKIAHITSLAKEYRVDGVIYYALRCCDPYIFKTERFRRVLEGMGIPMLDLVSEYTPSDLDELQIQVENFVETLELARMRG